MTEGMSHLAWLMVMDITSLDFEDMVSFTLMICRPPQLCMKAFTTNRVASTCLRTVLGLQLNTYCFSCRRIYTYILACINHMNIVNLFVGGIVHL